MKRKYFFVILFLVLAIFFIINAPSVNAKMYKILDSEGNVIRLTNNPVLSIEEKEAGCTISPPPGGSIKPIQDQITNEQEIKQQATSGSEKYDFRKTNWGMSKEEVKATEDKKQDFEDNIMLGYKVEVDGNDFACLYYFLENKLYQSGYVFDGMHTNKNDYINDYENLKEILLEKYGKPKMDRKRWKNDLYKNDKQDWGTAVSVGHLIYGSTWDTSTTEINLVLAGDNFEIKLTIVYYSRELKEWAKRIKEKEASKGF